MRRTKSLLCYGGGVGGVGGGGVGGGGVGCCCCGLCSYLTSQKK